MISLLDVIQETAQYTPICISRLAYIATWKSEFSKDDVGAFLTNVWQSSVVDDSIDVTGLCIIQENSIMNVMEASNATIVNILKNIKNTSFLTECPIENIKIIGSSDDVPEALFGQWVWRSMMTSKESDFDIELEGPQTASCSTNVYGKGATSETHDAVLNSLNRSNPDLLPSDERLVAMCSHSDIPDLGLYVSVLNDPVESVLESDKVWPVQPSLSTWLLQRMG